jgi:hypothetical protein
MKLQLLVIYLFLSFSSLYAQKGFVTELEYDSIYGLIRFKSINTTDSTLRVPAFDNIYSNFTITSPDGRVFIATWPSCNSDHWLLKPKQIVNSGGFFENILDEVCYDRNNRNPKPQELGIYKIDWMVEGQPTKTISINYKGKIKDKIPRKK